MPYLLHKVAVRIKWDCEKLTSWLCVLCFIISFWRTTCLKQVRLEKNILEYISNLGNPLSMSGYITYFQKQLSYWKRTLLMVSLCEVLAEKYPLSSSISTTRTSVKNPVHSGDTWYVHSLALPSPSFPFSPCTLFFFSSN